MADYDGRDDAGALDDLAASVGVVRAPPSTPLKAGGRAGHVIVRVGPFMEEYEELARGHMGGGSSQAALITCERSQARLLQHTSHAHTHAPCPRASPHHTRT